MHGVYWRTMRSIPSSLYKYIIHIYSAPIHTQKWIRWVRRFVFPKRMLDGKLHSAVVERQRVCVCVCVSIYRRTVHFPLKRRQTALRHRTNRIAPRPLCTTHGGEHTPTNIKRLSQNCIFEPRLDISCAWFSPNSKRLNRNWNYTSIHHWQWLRIRPYTFDRNDDSPKYRPGINLQMNFPNGHTRQWTAKINSESSWSIILASSIILFRK